MRTRELLTGVALIALVSLPALADLPCQPVSLPPPPLTVGAFLEEIFASVLQNGVAVLFVGSLAVVGLPWMMAGLAVGLLQLARRKP